MFSYAHVPYRIKPYADLLKDPYNTIDSTGTLEQQIEARGAERGTDGKLVTRPDGQVLQVSLAEKLLTLLLAKLANFVPEGGIWMNTQRPEWNDANNALVGKGLSVVTLGYLRRYLVFCQDLFSNSDRGRAARCGGASLLSSPMRPGLLALQPPRFPQRFRTQAVGLLVADELILAGVESHFATEEDRNIRRMADDVGLAGDIGIGHRLAAHLDAIAENRERGRSPGSRRFRRPFCPRAATAN